MLLNKKLIIPLLFCSLTGCDKMQQVSGIVLDDSNHRPLPDANIYEIRNATLVNNHTEYTDSQGYFEYERMVHPGHGPFVLAFSKEGYGTIQRQYEKDFTQQDTILLPHDSYHPIPLDSNLLPNYHQ